jgi:hypothetical protein
MTLPDVPPSVCYLSGRRRQRRGPKPGGQRNLDPKDRPWTREPTRRLPASRRSGASSPGRVNPGEVLIKAVSKVEPKMLSGSDQKGTWPGAGVAMSLAADDAPPAERHDPPPRVIGEMNEVTPSPPREGRPTAKGADETAGKG